MKNNRMRNISSVALFTIAIFVAINIHNSEAKMTTAQVRNMAKPMGKNCMAKTGVSKELVDKTHDGEFPSDPALQCYFSCIYKMIRATTKDDLLDINMIMKQIDLMMTDDLAAATKVLSQTCYTRLTSTDPCVQSWEYTKCFYDVNPELYFFP